MPRSIAAKVPKYLREKIEGEPGLSLLNYSYLKASDLIVATVNSSSYDLVVKLFDSHGRSQAHSRWPMQIRLTRLSRKSSRKLTLGACPFLTGPGKRRRGILLIIRLPYGHFSHIGVCPETRGTLLALAMKALVRASAIKSWFTLRLITTETSGLRPVSWERV